MRSRRKNQSGFTLIELLIVAIIVAVLAAVGIPLIQGNVARARLTEADAGLGTIRTAMRAELAENAKYPSGTGFKATDKIIAATIGLNTGDLCGRFFGDDSYAFGKDVTDTEYCVGVTGSGSDGKCPGGAPRGSQVKDVKRSMNQDGFIYDKVTDCSANQIN